MAGRWQCCCMPLQQQRGYQQTSCKLLQEQQQPSKQQQLLLLTASNACRSSSRCCHWVVNCIGLYSQIQRHMFESVARSRVVLLPGSSQLIRCTAVLLPKLCRHAGQQGPQEEDEPHQRQGPEHHEAALEEAQHLRGVCGPGGQVQVRHVGGGREHLSAVRIQPQCVCVVAVFYCLYMKSAHQWCPLAAMSGSSRRCSPLQAFVKPQSLPCLSEAAGACSKKATCHLHMECGRLSCVFPAAACTRVRLALVPYMLAYALLAYVLPGDVLAPQGEPSRR